MTSRQLAYLLIAAGVMGLFARTAGLSPVPAAAWVAVAWGATGVLWARTESTSRRALGTGLLAIAALSGAGALVGVVPTGLVSAAFLGVWWRRPRRSWPLLVGGLTASVTVTAVAGTVATAWNPAPLFFLGFAATFAALYLLPEALGGGRRWAAVPAVVFTLLTVVTNDPSRSLPDWLLPAALIIGGLAMLSGVRRR